MIRHDAFIKWLIATFPNTDKALINRIAAQTSKGVTPEICAAGKEQLLKAIVWMPESYFGEGVAVNTDVPPANVLVQRDPPRYKLGQKSLDRLEGVHPSLVAVVKSAITITTQDFTVLEGLRTLSRQQELLKQGATRTLQSKHLKQSDGYGHAVDLGAWNNGKVTWDWDDYFEIVRAMDTAATKLGFAHRVRWGGIWDRVLMDYGGDLDSAYKEAVESYKIRHKGSDFLDGPHFEWVA